MAQRPSLDGMTPQQAARVKAAFSLMQTHPQAMPDDATIVALPDGFRITGFEGATAELSVTHGSLTLAYGDKSADVTFYLTPASSHMLIRALQLVHPTLIAE